MARNPKVEVVTVEHHRNGISGEPFHVVLFNWTDDDGRARKMLATVFSAPMATAVLDVEQAARGEVGFGVNSWRGDQFDAALRRAIAAAS